MIQIMFDGFQVHFWILFVLSSKWSSFLFPLQDLSLPCQCRTSQHSQAQPSTSTELVAVHGPHSITLPCKYAPPSITALCEFKSMDLQAQTNNSSSSRAQLPVDTSNKSLEQRSSTSFQSPAKHEILSISSLVPSTVLTLIPFCKPTPTGNLYPEFPSSSDITSEPPGTVSSHSASPETQDQTTVPSPLSYSGNPAELQQRKPSDEYPVEERSVGLMLPKELHNEDPGMVIIKSGTLM